MQNVKSNNRKVRNVQLIVLFNVWREVGEDMVDKMRFTICSERECEAVSSIVECFRNKRPREHIMRILKGIIWVAERAESLDDWDITLGLDMVNYPWKAGLMEA